MKTIRCVLAIASSACFGAAYAQAEADVPHDGRWSATLQTADGHRQTARLVLAEFAGSWWGAAGADAATKPACAGRRLPITVQASTQSTLEFTVWGSQVSPKCRDLTVALKAVGDQEFEGTVESIGSIRLKRR